MNKLEYKIQNLSLPMLKDVSSCIFHTEGSVRTHSMHADEIELAAYYLCIYI